MNYWSLHTFGGPLAYLCSNLATTTCLDEYVQQHFSGYFAWPPREWKNPPMTLKTSENKFSINKGCKESKNFKTSLGPSTEKMDVTISLSASTQMTSMKCGTQHFKEEKKKINKQI